MPLSFRLGAFYFAYFAQVGAYVAYFPLYLAWRGLGAIEIAGAGAPSRRWDAGRRSFPALPTAPARRPA